jgi:subtilase family serine protease
MRGFRALAVTLAVCGTLFFATAGGGANDNANYRAVCPAAFASANCHALVVTDAHGNPNATTSPTGLAPADLKAAYSLTGLDAARTIAIVDAYDDPYIANDLATFSSTFGIPCNGCLVKVDQRGGTAYPRGDPGWSLEIALDVETAHGICPGCKILLVEADSNSFANLAAAEDTAARLGASVISNSYGGSEYSSETVDEAHFNHPGVAITVSSGDNGYGVEFPSASQYVTAVGGTTLTRSANARGWSETVWSGAGSGCSAYEPKPTWQTDAGCSRRTVADVAADADPASGASVYDSYRYQGQKGWFKVGGTSLAAPIVGAVYALSGNTAGYGSYPYSHTSSLFDVTSGSNGSCGGSYLCTGATGYDGPTGLGTPNGIGGL